MADDVAARLKRLRELCGATTHASRGGLLARLDAFEEQLRRGRSRDAVLRGRALAAEMMTVAADGALPGHALDALAALFDRALPEAYAATRAPAQAKPGVVRVAMRAEPAADRAQLVHVADPITELATALPPEPRPAENAVRLVPAPEARPRVKRIAETGAALDDAAHRLRWVEIAFDQLAMLCMHRATLPLGDRRAREGRALATLDALFSVGDGAATDAVYAFDQAKEPTPHALAALCLVLGCVTGAEALDAVERAIRRMPRGDGAFATAAAGALASSNHPDVVDVARSWLDADHPLVRATAIGVLARRRVAQPDALIERLSDPALVVVAAAIRAISSVVDAPLPREIGRAARLPDADVAWEASRALAIWGSAEPIDAVRGRHASPSFAAALAPARRAEIVVMQGDEADLAALHAVAARAAPTPELLSAVARFGARGAWAYLVQQLSLAEFRDAAGAALTTLFGPIVVGLDVTRPAPWKAALARASLPEGRLRGGAAWSPLVVARELATGDLTAAGAAARVDELMARTGRFDAPDLDAWADRARAPLQAFDARFVAADKKFSRRTPNEAFRSLTDRAPLTP